MAYDNVYSPWRSEYFGNSDSKDSKDNNCVFCEISREILSQKTPHQNYNYKEQGDAHLLDSKNLVDLHLPLDESCDSKTTSDKPGKRVQDLKSLDPKNLESKEKANKSKYVFYSDDICFCVMNRYPYTPGHFMIIPHAHIDTPTLLPKKQWLHISSLSQRAIKLLESYGADGVNMGINVKASAGAGIPSHLHIHFVPRFQSDTNFITAISHTRVYGLDFDKVFHRILELSKEIFRD